MDIGAIAEELGAFVPDFDHRRDTFIAILRAHSLESAKDMEELISMMRSWERCVRRWRCLSAIARSSIFLSIYRSCLLFVVIL